MAGVPTVSNRADATTSPPSARIHGQHPGSLADRNSTRHRQAGRVDSPNHDVNGEYPRIYSRSSTSPSRRSVGVFFRAPRTRTRQTKERRAWVRTGGSRSGSRASAPALGRSGRPLLLLQPTHEHRPPGGAVALASRFRRRPHDRPQATSLPGRRGHFRQSRPGLPPVQYVEEEPTRLDASQTLDSASRSLRGRRGSAAPEDTLRLGFVTSGLLELGGPPRPQAFEARP